MIGIESHPDGAVLHVRVRARAAQTEIRGHQGGRLKLCVTAAAEKGKANKAVLKLLSKLLGIPQSRLEIITGATSSAKRILFYNATPESLANMVDRALRPSR